METKKINQKPVTTVASPSSESSAQADDGPDKGLFRRGNLSGSRKSAARRGQIVAPNARSSNQRRSRARTVGKTRSEYRLDFREALSNLGEELEGIVKEILRRSSLPIRKGCYYRQKSFVRHCVADVRRARLALMKPASTHVHHTYESASGSRDARWARHFGRPIEERRLIEAIRILLSDLRVLDRCEVDIAATRARKLRIAIPILLRHLGYDDYDAARKLAKEWFGSDAQKEKIKNFLAEFQLSETAIEAVAVQHCSKEYDLLSRMQGSTEHRRDRTLRSIREFNDLLPSGDNGNQEPVALIGAEPTSETKSEAA